MRALSRKRKVSGAEMPATCRWLFVGVCLVAVGCGGDSVGELIARLESGDVAQRRSAVQALGERADADGRAIAALTKCVSDADAEVRYVSIRALGARGNSARSSLPALEASLGDPDSRIRVAAALAIQKIEPRNEKFRSVLASAMRAGDGRVLLAVGEMGSDGAWAVPTLKELLSHNSAKMRSLAARTLGRIGPAAAEARSALERAAGDANAAVQDAARDALERIGPEREGRRESAKPQAAGRKRGLGDG